MRHASGRSCSPVHLTGSPDIKAMLLHQCLACASCHSYSFRPGIARQNNMDLLDVPAWDTPTPDRGYPTLQLRSREPGATAATLSACAKFTQQAHPIRQTQASKGPVPQSCCSLSLLITSDMCWRSGCQLLNCPGGILINILETKCGVLHRVQGNHKGAENISQCQNVKGQAVQIRCSNPAVPTFRGNLHAWWPSRILCCCPFCSHQHIRTFCQTYKREAEAPECTRCSLQLTECSTSLYP